jgi:hypothetical protein
MNNKKYEWMAFLWVKGRGWPPSFLLIPPPNGKMRVAETTPKVLEGGAPTDLEGGRKGWFDHPQKVKQENKKLGFGPLGWPIHPPRPWGP